MEVEIQNSGNIDSIDDWGQNERYTSTVAK